MKITIIVIATCLSCAAFADATLTLQQPNDPTPIYAAELFGSPEVRIELEKGVRLVIGPVNPVDPVHIDKGGIAHLTFTLTNGTFGSPVSVQDLKYFTEGEGRVSMSKVSGGGVNESSVTYAISVSTAIVTASHFSFNIGELAGLSEPGVDITAAIQLITATKKTWPREMTGNDTVPLIAIAPGYVPLTEQIRGREGLIALDDRTVIMGAPEPRGMEPYTGIRALRLGSLRAQTTNPPALDTTGAEFNEDGAGKGVFEVVVTGKFNAGDKVCVAFPEPGDDQNCEQELTVQDNQATGAVPIVDWPGAYLWYIPVGGGELVPTTFTVNATMHFDLATNISLYNTPPTVGTLKYDGLDRDGWAAAVPPSRSSDMAFIRLTNETNEEVTFFGHGYGQDGEDLGFVEICVLIPRETRVIKSEELEDLFGKWNGRARFDFSATGNISVQTLIRSGGILNNMTGSTGMHTEDAQIVR